MYKPVLDSVGGSLALTAIFAALPLLILFVLLGALRMKAWVASLIALGIAVAVAVVAYSMPVGQVVLVGLEGAVFGFFPILWIVINAIWLYNMTVTTGHFDVLRRSFGKISDDQRIQGVIIAFCFGALLEALAGFGTPVAITSVMLIALGFRPIKAATVALVANTAPVAFGALAVPITTLAAVTGLPQSQLAAMVGRQTPILALFVPIILVFIIDRGRGVRATLPATLTVGITFAVTQFITSNFLSVPLTDVVAALASAGAVVLLLRVWQPANSYVEERELVEVGARAGAPKASAPAGGGDHPVGAGVGSVDELAARDAGQHDTPVEVLRAYSPYLIIIVVFVIAQIPAVKAALDSVTQIFVWPGLNLQTAGGDPSKIPLFKFNWLGSPGTLMIFAGLLTIPAIDISLGKAAKAYAHTYRQLALAIITVMAVLALAYVMNASGQTGTLGAWLAGAGALFALISPVMGWLGVAVTGSDTSANSLFGALQVAAAGKTGLDPVLMAAANSSGGVLGKMISPQNLAIAAGAVGMAGREGDLFRKVIGWSLGFLAFMAVLIFLQSTPILSWMVP